MFHDLREFIKKADEIGECKVVEGADWDLEIGAIGDLLSQTPESPLLVFDRIRGFPPGYRVVTNLATTQKRIALAYGLSPEATGMELVKAFRSRLKAGIKGIPPVEVKTGPVKDDVLTGDDVDVLRFPAPRWHELDGGRLIGTGSAVVVRDPDEGWINVGAYRVQVQDRRTLTMNISTGHHGDLIARKYWAKGRPCPMAICCGQAPILSAAAGHNIPWGVSEYDWAGGWQGQPVEVTRGVTTDLPVPATAEIVLEGELVAPEVETMLDGPAGENYGYYVPAAQMPVFRVESIMHRDNPIIQGNPPAVLPSVWTLGRHILVAAAVWDELDAQMPGVRGVWMMEEATMQAIPVISLQQLYGGHAKQAALVVAGSHIGGYKNSYIIVVDEDIDPSNTSEVLWALATRSDPSEMDVVHGCWGNRSYPRLTPEQRRIDDRTHPVGIILACKPYKWMKEFPPSIKTSPELARKVKDRFPGLFRSTGK